MRFNLDEYVTVHERVERFYAKYPQGRITTTILEHNAETGFVLMRAEVYATIIVNDCARRARNRATPPHRQNQLSVALLGFGQLVQTRDYTDGLTVCQARAGAAPPGRKKSPPGPAFLLHSAPVHPPERRKS